MASNRASSCFNVLRLCVLRRKISERVLQIPQSKANIVKMKTEIVQGSTEVQPTIDEWRVYASIRIGGKILRYLAGQMYMIHTRFLSFNLFPEESGENISVINYKNSSSYVESILFIQHHL